jgi:hypothetical protein
MPGAEESNLSKAGARAQGHEHHAVIPPTNHLKYRVL